MFVIALRDIFRYNLQYMCEVDAGGPELIVRPRERRSGKMMNNRQRKMQRTAGIFRIVAVLAAAVLFALCAKTARADSDNRYLFDGEGEYILVNRQTGSRLVCHSGSGRISLTSAVFTESSSDTRFFFREIGPNRYTITTAGNEFGYLNSYAYGNRLEIKKDAFEIPSSATWEIVPNRGGIAIVNSATGRYLASFGFEVYMKAPAELATDTDVESTLWMPVRSMCYGSREDAPVRQLQVEEREVEKALAKSAEIPVNDIFGFSWGPLSRAEDFTVWIDRPEVLRVSFDGTLSVQSQGEATVMLRHRYTGQRLRANIRVCNNGIVIVPGFMGAELVNRKNEKIWSESLLSELTNGFSLSALSRFSSLSSPSAGDGVRAVDNSFGALDLYKELYRVLIRTYGKDAAVEFFPYDWRKSSAESGAELARYLEGRGYDNVVLVCHSFGGLVCAQALAQSDYCVEHTALACMVGVPMNGSAGIAEAWAKDRFGNALGLGSFGSVENAAIRKIIGTFPSIYEMLPSAYAVETLGVIGGCGSYDSFVEACAKKCGSFDKKLAAAAGEVGKKLYRDGVCAIDRVPTAWYGGTDRETVVSTTLSGGELQFARANEGDGIVTVAECVAGTKTEEKDAFTAPARHLWVTEDGTIIADIAARIAELPGFGS